MENKSKFLKMGFALLAIVIIIILLFLGLRKREYDINFDSSGGSFVAPFQIERNSRIAEPKDPVKEGYIFAGWYYNDELYDFSKKVTKDMKLEAKWIKADEITGIELEQSELILKPGATEKLIATLLPMNIKNVYIVWSSSDPDVVSVDELGNIKALKEGTATITVKTKDGKHKVKVKIKVSEDAVNVTGVSLDKTDIKLNVNESTKLTATIKPNNATNKDVTWSSSDSSVATVDADGNIKALKEGTVTITVKSNDGGYTATATVKVSAVEVTSVSLNKSSVSLYLGESTKLSATINPSNATNKGVTWSSSNSSVATVDANGNIKAISEGTTTITVKTSDGGYTAKCTVTVKKSKVTGVSLSNSAISLTVGNGTKLTATVSPSNATNKGVTWSSSNSSIATVDSSGNVRAISPGTATITVKTNDGGYTASCTVTVKEKVSNYVVIYTPIVQEGTGAILQYSVAVTKDGSTFSDYSFIIYDGKKVGTTLSTVQYNNSVTSATVRLTNGSDVTATVVYK